MLTLSASAVALKMVDLREQNGNMHCMPASPIPAQPDLTEAPATIDDVRLLIAIKLAVAPQHILTALAKPSTPAAMRDRARDELVAHLTKDMALWRFVKVVRTANLAGGGPGDTAARARAPDHGDVAN